METNLTKLLIVDDEPDLLAELKPLLERSAYTVFTRSNGQEALDAVVEIKPDLIILDMLMPKMDGRAVVRQLRQAGNWTPVILLTQVNTSSERVLSLQEGADDYLNKPFDPLELLARIEAILRRSAAGMANTANGTLLISGDLKLDRQARKVTLAKTTIELTGRAFDLLAYLMAHSQGVVTRDKLLDEIWGWAYAVSTRAVDIRVAEIRKKLQDEPSDPKYIETVVGQGYRFVGTVTSN